MNLIFDERPIIACSTPMTSNGAIGVIRISGFNCLSQFQSLFSFDLSKITPKKVFFSQIKDKGGEIYDEILGTFFKAPHSYNGENILEISVHGNLVNIQRIISLFVENSDLRLAHEGEFTYRALKNNKISLSQVEGLDCLLNATSPLMLKQGMGLLHGKLHEKYDELYKAYLKLKAGIELSIDFLEDVGEERANGYFSEALSEITYLITELFQKIQGPLSHLISPEVLLIGATNAGKSSLFNALLKANRSIVSSVPGTTRDYVSEYFYIHETPFKLVDTAGIRESENEIEKEGIFRTKELLSTAFFRILVINPFETKLEDFNFFLSLNTQFDLVVFTHLDREDFFNKKSLLPEELKVIPSFNVALVPSKNIDFTGSIGPARLSKLDAKCGPIEPESKNEDMMHFLSKVIYEKYLELTKNNPILINRHRALISSMHNHITHFHTVISQEKFDVGIHSHEVNLLGQLISELVGIVTPDDVLTSIFSNFCIGK